MKQILSILTLLVLLISFTACNAFQQGFTESQNTIPNNKQKHSQTNKTNPTETVVLSRSSEVLASIKARDMEKLSQFIDPGKGMRFSPYGHVNTSSDLIFSADKIKNILTDNNKYLWGSYDGSGEPIKLTFKDYFNKFVYDMDFINAKQIGFNKILGKGNTLINTAEVYPNAQIVEYYFPGPDPQYKGMDWKSLRLVFEKEDDKWYLTGIIHDQWTI